MSERLERGMTLPELKVTPDRHLTVRYAGASGDFNPIHIDEEFARAVGLPGRILHGLWTMAQVARCVTEAAGGAVDADGNGRLRSLDVQFRGLGVPEEEITVTATVAEVAGGIAAVDAVAEQCGTQIVRNARAEITLP